MEFNNTCVVCHGRGIRLDGMRCGVCEGRGYIRPVGNLTFVKMVFSLAGLIAVCGLCGYFAVFRDLYHSARPTGGAVATPSTAPRRFQDFYDDLVRAGRTGDIDHLVSKLDTSLYRIWTPEQCAASVRGRDLNQELPEGRLTTFSELKPYNYNITDETGTTYATTLDHAYDVTVELSSGGESDVTFGEADGALTWFTPCD